jgi:hypothetical protein
MELSAPTEPESTELPVFVTPAFPRTEKLPAVPRVGAEAASGRADTSIIGLANARDMTNMSNKDGTLCLFIFLHPPAKIITESNLFLYQPLFISRTAYLTKA